MPHPMDLIETTNKRLLFQERESPMFKSFPVWQWRNKKFVWYKSYYCNSVSHNSLKRNPSYTRFHSKTERTTKCFFQRLKLLKATLSKMNNFVVNHTFIWYTTEEKMRYKINRITTSWNCSLKVPGCKQSL